MLETLNHANTVAGAKQARRALSSGRAEALFVADDADPRVTLPLAELAREKGVTVNHIPLMKTLGAACGIAVGCAAAVRVSL